MVHRLPEAKINSPMDAHPGRRANESKYAIQRVRTQLDRQAGRGWVPPGAVGPEGHIEVVSVGSKFSPLTGC